MDATFAGGDRRRFDLVIGADGLHSGLRSMVFGPPEQFICHLWLALAICTVPNEFGLDRWALDYHEEGRSAVLRRSGSPSTRSGCARTSRAEIGRMHVRSLTAPGPDAGPGPEVDMDAFMTLVERAVGGPDLPDFDGRPDRGAAT